MQDMTPEEKARALEGDTEIEVYLYCVAVLSALLSCCRSATELQLSRARASRRTSMRILTLTSYA
jgi:hypothetical protein